MADRWRLASLQGTLEIVARRALRGEHAAPPPHDLAAVLERSSRDPVGQRVLEEMYASVYGQSALRVVNPVRGEEIRRTVIPGVVRAVVRGDLVVLGRGRRTHIVASSGGGTPREEPVEPEQSRPRALTWIEIELVDEDDNPVPYQRYEVVLPDGSVRTGRLNEFGFARLDGIDEGQCTVTFPEFDKRAWEACLTGDHPAG